MFDREEVRNRLLRAGKAGILSLLYAPIKASVGRRGTKKALFPREKGFSGKSKTGRPQMSSSVALKAARNSALDLVFFNLSINKGMASWGLSLARTLLRV